MVYVTLTHTQKHTKHLSFGLVNRVQQVFANLQQRRELQKLLRRPDYELRDIGLLRSEIAKVANRSLWD